MPKGSDYIQKAAQIADNEISIDRYGDYLSVSYTTESIDRINEFIKKALELEPDNKEYKYWLSCAEMGKGNYESGLKNIKELSLSYPEYLELNGHAEYPEKWFSSFYYPVWNEKTRKVPESLLSLPEEGMSIISLRDGLRRVVSFFRPVDASVFKVIDEKSPVELRFNYMRTPYGDVAGCYVLVLMNKKDWQISETIVNVNSCPSNIRDMSNAGYWLLRLLAQQNYTYVILSDSGSNQVLNRKIYFSAVIKRNLAQLKFQIESVTPCDEFDAQLFQKARQYYMDCFSLDELLRNI